MTPEAYFDSDEFRLFADEQLRENACQAAESFLKDNDPVDNSQLHAIPGVIQAGGLSALRALVMQQKGKNTFKKNKAFWEFLHDLVFVKPGPAYSLQHAIEKELAKRNFLEDESGVAEKKDQKRIRKDNKKLVEKAMAEVLAVYFEHFNCHYFYKNRRGG